MKNIFLLSCMFIILTPCAFGQVVWEHPSHSRIYDFLDEMASAGIISLNADVKPYSRDVIAKFLSIIEEQKPQLNQRQQNELQTFLIEYALELKSGKTSKRTYLIKNNTLGLSIQPVNMYYADSLFRLSVSPIWGRQYTVKKDDFAYHNQGGFSCNAYIADNIGIYANVRDNYLKNAVLAKPTYLTNYEGGNYKLNEGGRPGGDYSEMRGGITWSWKWGSLGLVKDHVEWGYNHNGATIFNGKTPSFAMIKLNANPAPWFDFNYFHAWLVSMVVDSSRSYTTQNGDFRAVYQNKYLAANMFTFRPWKHLHISLGNSIIYSDMNIHPAYLIPCMFYKSIDHTLNKGIDNQNSQMFVSIHSRSIRNVHLFASYFIDEWSFTRVFDETRRNFTSVKAGAGIYNIGIPNTSLYMEFTQTSPITYKHRVPTLTYATNLFNLGHYLGDNARDIYVALKVKPIAGVEGILSGGIAEKANDYPYLRIPGQRVDEYPLLKDIIWSKKYVELAIHYYPATNVRLNVSYTYSEIIAHEADGKTADYYAKLFGSDFLAGLNHLLNMGLLIGF